MPHLIKIVLCRIMSFVSSQFNSNFAFHQHYMIPYFFPRFILYIFILFWLIYGGLGFWGLGLMFGFRGWGFQLMGFGACGVELAGFFGLGLSI